MMKEASNEEKAFSSINGVGKTGQLHVKEWKTGPLSNTIYKNKFKMG